jgi:hypothetical protein
MRARFSPPVTSLRAVGVYLPNRSQDEIAALNRVAAALGHAGATAPDGGGFAEIHVEAESDAAARRLVLTAIETAQAADLVELA